MKGRFKKQRTLFEAVHYRTTVKGQAGEQSYNLRNACRLSQCREYFANRQESLLDHHERSFQRFFGYRSLWHILPSKWFDKFLLLLVTFLLRPLTFGLIYFEIVVLTVLYFFRAMLTTLWEIVSLVLWTLSLRWVFSTFKSSNDDELDGVGTHERLHRERRDSVSTQESWHRQRRSHFFESGQLGVKVPLMWLSYEAWLKFWAGLGTVVAMLGWRRKSFQEFKDQLTQQSTFARISTHYY